MTRIYASLFCAVTLAAAACGSNSPASPSGADATAELRGSQDKILICHRTDTKYDPTFINANTEAIHRAHGDAKPGEPVPADPTKVFDRNCVPVSPVTIKKFTNGDDANVAPGPTIAIGAAVTWTYEVTNNSAFTFSSLSVTDDKGVVVACPKELPAPGASITCTGSGTATAGQYTNVGKVTVTGNGNQYTDSDTSHYFGNAPQGVRIRKFTNGQAARDAPGPTIAVGSPITWTYEVTNTSPFTFSSLSVTDDRGVQVLCPSVLPGPGGSITCTGSGTAVAGAYRNVGTATATAANGTRYTDSDASHYFGGPLQAVTIRKLTNGQDVSSAPGPSIAVGSPVTWTYVVTNTSPFAFSSLSVTDDRGVQVLCPSVLPAPGASITCTGSGTAVAGQYRNVGTAVATVNGNAFTDRDESFYLGVTPTPTPEPEIKVQLCHRTGNGSYHMIEVSINAEPAHRAHGDGMVGDAVPGSPGKKFTASCGVQ